MSIIKDVWNYPIKEVHKGRLIIGKGECVEVHLPEEHYTLTVGMVIREKLLFIFRMIKVLLILGAGLAALVLFVD